MNKFLLLPLLFSILAVNAQSFEFNNSDDGWEIAQGSLATDATSISLTFDAGQNPKLRRAATPADANIDASVNSILAITMRNTSEIDLIKVRHERLATSGNRFVTFDVDPFNLTYVTYYFDLSNAEWDNNGTAGSVQNDIEILFRAPGDNAATSSGKIEIDRIAFVSNAERLDYTFEVDGNDEGWNARFQSNITTANGVGVWDLTTNTNTSNPRLRQEIFRLNGDNNQYAHLVVRNRSADNQIRITFNNAAGASGARNGNMTAYTSGAGVFEVLDIDMTTNTPEWNGVITQIEFLSRDTSQGGNPSNRTGAIDIERIVFDNNPTLAQPYIYTTAGWEPNDPAGVSTNNSNLYVRDDVAFTGDVNFNNLYVSTGATLTLGTNTLNAASDLFVSGTLDASEGTINLAGINQQVIKADEITVEDLIINNAQGVLLNANLNLEGVITLTNGALQTQPSDVPTGVLTFKSSNGKTAIVEEVISGSINGEVTIEQFYPANRAFRFVSSPVNMTGTIFSDWQQDGLNPGDAGFESETGTHITGGIAADGYDQSGSNAPSLFSFNNAYTDINNSWTAFTAPTNTTSVNAGEAYRLFVRGDRNVSLTTSNPTATDTKLITRGTIVSGAQSITPATVDGNFVFVGNPYQAQVDLTTVLAASEDVNPNTYYAWNPSMNNYVAYSFVMGGIQNDVSEFIQPGQSYFVLIADDGDADVPSINYTEADKIDATSTTATFSTPQAYLVMTLENNSNVTKDRVTLIFDDQGTNSITDQDAPKFKGTDEQLMIMTNSSQLAIDDRLTPVDQEIIQLNIENLSTGNYQFTANASGFNIPAYLEDQFTGQFILLDASNPTTIPFSVDTNVTASVDSDRFRVHFSNTTLGLNDSAFAKAISLYPNPTYGDAITLVNLSGNEVITVTNLLGQEILKTVALATNHKINVSGLQTGTYLAIISSQEKTETLKFIKN